MLGWPATPFGLGWFGHPQAGWSRGGQTPKNKILSDWPKGDRTTPWATGGGSAAPRPWAKRSNFRLA
jgi:hypothetical protein